MLVCVVCGRSLFGSVADWLLAVWLFRSPFADSSLLLRVAFSGLVLFQFSVLGSAQVSVRLVVRSVRLHF